MKLIIVTIIIIGHYWMVGLLYVGFCLGCFRFHLIFDVFSIHWITVYISIYIYTVICTNAHVFFQQNQSIDNQSIIPTFPARAAETTIYPPIPLAKWYSNYY